MATNAKDPREANRIDNFASPLCQVAGITVLSKTGPETKTLESTVR